MDQNTNSIDHLIIGAGFAGICMGIRLKQAGIQNFIIIDRNNNMGGTWLDNIYPGAACDVRSHLYSFSFEPYKWDKVFGMQKEILSYIEHCASKYELTNHFQFNINVKAVIWNEDSKKWQVTSEDGQSFSASMVYSCSGSLSQPSYPDIKGIKEFSGKMFHTARWDEDFDFTNKTVGIIGTGASSVQVTPFIADKVKKLYLYQRTAPWVLPKSERKISSIEKWLFQNISFSEKFLRNWYYWENELRAIGFVRKSKMMKMVERSALKTIASIVKDENLLKKITPPYTLGCKRVLLSNDYYKTLLKKNVTLITEGIKEFNADGVVTNDGVQQNLDAIILATGFKAAEDSIPYDVIGKDRVSLKTSWKNGAEAFLGTSVSGFPNFFFIVGPNTGLGHSSRIIMIEAQVSYIISAIAYMQKEKIETLDVKESKQLEYNSKLQTKMQKTVWQSGGCKSWYQTKEGKNVTLWPGFTFTFIMQTKKFNPENYFLQN